MWLSNAVFVDRKNRQDAVKTFAKAADDMKRKGMSIFIFAEGGSVRFSCQMVGEEGSEPRI